MHKLSFGQTVWTGTGCIAKIADETEKFNAKQVMIYTDHGVIKAGLLDKVIAILERINVKYDVYTEIRPEPPLEVGNRAIEALRGKPYDLVIGLGGGSAIDVAKACAVMYTHEGSLEDYLFHTGTKKIVNRGLPMIMIPTTAGTGSEATNVSVFSLETSKDVIAHDYLLPDVAVVDPELTYNLPPAITAATGIDAFTHAIEAYTSKLANPISDTLAIRAMELTSANVRQAVWEGNKEAREAMSLGSLLAGMAFQSAGVCGVHALAYPIGGRFHVPHGASNAVMLPHVMRFIYPATLPKMGIVAEILKEPVERLSPRDRALAVVEAITNMVVDVGLPLHLGAYGITSDDVDVLVSDGVKQKRLLVRSPRPMSADDIRELYTSAL